MNAPDPVREHESFLRGAYASGQRTWAGLPLPFPRFAERVVALLVRRLRASGEPRPEARVGDVLQRLAVTDLFLAIACDEQVPGAWDRFHASYHPRLLALARQRRVPGVTGADIVADVCGALLAPPAHGQARTRIGTYDGTGSLFGWLAAILVRDVADRCRAASMRRRVDSVAEDEGGALPGGERLDEHGPLAAAIDAETRDELRSALHRIWSELSEPQRLVLLLRYRDGVAQTRIARLLHLSESRVSRVLAAALGTIRTGLEPRLSALGSGTPDGTWGPLRDALGLHLQESSPPADHPVERLP